MTIRPLLAVTLLAACGTATPMRLDPTASSPIHGKVYPVSCDDAHRYAVKALRTNGYQLTDGGRTAAGGWIEGVKEGSTNSRIDVQCGASGVTMNASGGGSWVEQGLRFSFNQISEFGDKIWPPPTSLRVNADLVAGPEVKVEFPQDPTSAGVSVLRVHVVNGAERAVRVDPRQIVAKGAGGGGTRPIPEAEARTRLSAVDPNLPAKLLPAAKLAKGAEAKGYVFFPAGTYSSATVTIIDDPTGEPDEFEFEFRK